MSAGTQLSTATQYRKKPVAVQAWEITPQLFDQVFGEQPPDLLGVRFHLDASGHYVTLIADGEAHRGELGDFIVRGASGKLGLYTAAAFQAHYDAVPPTLTLEQEIQAKGLTAPRVTPQQLESVIAGEFYFTAEQGSLAWGAVAVYLDAAAKDAGIAASPLRLLTLCVLVLRNGFTVVGKAACASPENFNAELGRKIARADAVNQLWPLEGYLLKQRLHLNEQMAIAGGISEEKRAELQAQADLDRLERIAKTCHEINRAYCASLGDLSQPAWEDAPEHMRSSSIAGVKFALANPLAGPEAQHNAWLEAKRAEGWTWGPVKDSVLKQHPCFVPYQALPREQQAKDYLFRATVQQLAGE